MDAALKKEIEAAQPYPWDQRPPFKPLLVCPRCKTNHNGSIGSDDDVREQLEDYKAEHDLPE